MTTVSDKRKPATETLKFSGAPAPIHVEYYAGSIGKKGKGHKPAVSVEFDSWDDCVEDYKKAIAVEGLPLRPRPGEDDKALARRIKNLLPYIGPYALREGTTRNDANVEMITLLKADCDRCDMYAVIERIGALDIAALVYTSPSDHPGLAEHERKFRVVCPLSRHILPSECAYSGQAFAEALGLAPGCGQEEVLSPHLGFFAGRMPGTPEREIETFTGGPIDVDVLLKRELKHNWTATRKAVDGAKPVDKSPLLPIGDVEPRDEPVLAAVLQMNGPPGMHHDRRMTMRATGSYLQSKNFSEERIAAIVSRVPTANEPSTNVAQAIEGAREKKRGITNTAGPNWLKKVNEDALNALDRATENPFARRAREQAEAEEAKRAAEAEAKEAANDDCPKGTGGTEPTPPDPSEDDWDAPEQPIDWYCEALGIAPSERKITLIAGDPGSGKGPLAGYLAMCFALGVPAFGAFPCKQCNVGILDFEGARLSKRRIQSFARGIKRKPAELKGKLFVRNCDPGAWGDLHEWLEARSIKVLIVDSYMSAMSASKADPNSPEYAELARELGKLGIVVIVIAHARKPAAGKKGERPSLGDVAGSYALGGMAATAIAVWKPEEDQPNLVRIGCMRAPDEAFETFDITWTKDHTAPTDAQVWTANMKGSAGKQARAEIKTQTATEARDQHLTIAAQVLIAFMARNPHMRQSATALRESDVHERDIRSVLAALLAAGHVDHQPHYKSGGRSKGDWCLKMGADDKPPRVVFKEGKAVPDPDDREIHTKFGFRKPKPAAA